MIVMFGRLISIQRVLPSEANIVFTQLIAQNQTKTNHILNNIIAK